MNEQTKQDESLHPILLGSPCFSRFGDEKKKTAIKARVTENWFSLEKVISSNCKIAATAVVVGLIDRITLQTSGTYGRVPNRFLQVWPLFLLLTTFPSDTRYQLFKWLNEKKRGKTGETKLKGIFTACSFPKGSSSFLGPNLTSSIDDTRVSGLAFPRHNLQTDIEQNWCDT